MLVSPPSHFPRYLKGETTTEAALTDVMKKWKKYVIVERSNEQLMEECQERYVAWKVTASHHWHMCCLWL